MSNGEPAPGITLTVRQAAQATGLTPKALRRRIERGSLRSQLVDERRRIAVADLMAAGLLVGGAAPGQRAPTGIRAGRPAAGPPAQVLERLQRELADERGARERLAEEIRALSARLLAVERRRYGG